MKPEVIKVSEKELVGGQLKGDFLYRENGEYYFNDHFYHSLFIHDADYHGQGECKGVPFAQHVTTFLEICSKVKNKPSLLFLNYVPKGFLDVLNSGAHNYNVLSAQTGAFSDKDLATINSAPTIGYVDTGYISALRSLIESRTVMPQNDVFVFFNEPEYSHNLKSPTLDTLVTIARSRKIYFVLNFENKGKYIESYGEESFAMIEENCRTEFVCGSDGVSIVQR